MKLDNAVKPLCTIPANGIDIVFHGKVKAKHLIAVEQMFPKVGDVEKGMRLLAALATDHNPQISNLELYNLLVEVDMSIITRALEILAV